MSEFKQYAPVSDEQLGFFIDSSRCSGCKACQVACKDKNNLEVGRRFRRIYDLRLMGKEHLKIMSLHTH